jgi:hypothetical protein
MAVFLTWGSVFLLGIISDNLGIKNILYTYTIVGGKTLDIWLFGLPLEDYILIATVPIWVMGIYEFFRRKTG